jgi:FixJ family two-component response regulator
MGMAAGAIMQDSTVIIVDDDVAVRDSLQALLDVAGYATECYASGIAFLKACTGSNNACVLLDVHMPKVGGLEILKRLRAVRSSSPVIMITGNGDMEMAVQAMRSGAVGFLQKPFQEDELLESVEHALSIAGDPHDRIAVSKAAQWKLERLTQREREVMELLVTGKLNGEIAHKLSCSLRTVEIYRARIMEKVGADNLPQLVRVAFLAGVQTTEK